MNDNVRKIFEMLGVEPNEEFKLKTYTGIELKEIYKIDSDLCIYKDNQFFNVDALLINILQGLMVIEKLPKKKKLRDLTEQEWDKWKDKKCIDTKCGECIFCNVTCWDDSDCWVYHKDLYSEKFLNQELEVEECLNM